MGSLEAFWGGFSSFFSIWQLCISQISPFFLVYLSGLHLTGILEGNRKRLRESVIIPSLFYMIGFSIFFSLVNSSGLHVGRIIFHSIRTLRLLSGVYILLLGLYMILSGRVGFLKSKSTPLIAIISLLLGAAFAIVYLPCITPTLSKILGMATLPEKATTGSILAFIYGLGLSLAFGLTGFVVITILGRVEGERRKLRLAKDICGALLIGFAFLSISGFMVYYKAFILGFF